jgi:hypothetical protein
MWDLVESIGQSPGSGMDERAVTGYHDATKP